MLPSAPLLTLGEFDGVRGLIGATTRDHLRAVAVYHLLRDLDKLHPSSGSVRGCLACGSRDDDAVRAVGDDVVDVLLNIGPVHFAVGVERRDECDEHLAERVGKG